MVMDINRGGCRPSRPIPTFRFPSTINFSCLEVLQDLPVEDIELPVEDLELPVEDPELPVEGEIVA